LNAATTQVSAKLAHLLTLLLPIRHACAIKTNSQTVLMSAKIAPQIALLVIVQVVIATPVSQLLLMIVTQALANVQVILQSYLKVLVWR